MLSLTCSGQSFSQQVEYSSLHRNWWVEYDDTSPGYVTDTGFFRRPDVRRAQRLLSLHLSSYAWDHSFAWAQRLRRTNLGSYRDAARLLHQSCPTASLSNIEHLFPRTFPWGRTGYGLSIIPR